MPVEYDSKWAYVSHMLSVNVAYKGLYSVAFYQPDTFETGLLNDTMASNFAQQAMQSKRHHALSGSHSYWYCGIDFKEHLRNIPKYLASFWEQRVVDTVGIQQARSVAWLVTNALVNHNAVVPQQIADLFTEDYE